MKNRFLNFQKLPWLVLLLLFITLADRLYWVNANGGLTGWMNAPTVTKEYIGCTDRSVEYKVLENSVRYRCSWIGGDIPVWPLYVSGSFNQENLAKDM